MQLLSCLGQSGSVCSATRCIGVPRRPLRMNGMRTVVEQVLSVCGLSVVCVERMGGIGCVDWVDLVCEGYADAYVDGADRLRDWAFSVHSPLVRVVLLNTSPEIGDEGISHGPRVVCQDGEKALSKRSAAARALACEEPYVAM